MNRFLLALSAGLLVANVALADAAPMPPKGKKFVNVTNEVVLDKDVTGYVFVTQLLTGPGQPNGTFSKLELTAGKAVALPGGKFGPQFGRLSNTLVNLFAVPVDAAKEFKTDAELFAALAAKKVKGAHSIALPGAVPVADTIKGDTFKWTYTISAIDAKDGIKAKVAGEGYEPPAPKKEPMSLGGSWVAGGAAALAVMLGGLWVVGRSRRKP